MSFDRAEHISEAIVKMLVEIEIYPGDSSSTLQQAFMATDSQISDRHQQAEYLRCLADILDPPTLSPGNDK